MGAAVSVDDTSRWELHDALLELLQNEPDAIDHERWRGIVFGMRYAAGIIGMPEGSTEYVWPETGTKL